MKTYQGERTEYGCEVTVDGKILRLRTDLTGAATTTFNWGKIGGRQLSLAMLADLLGDDEQALRLQDVFERKVIALLPHESWTMTEGALIAALDSINGRLPESPNGDGELLALQEARIANQRRGDRTASVGSEKRQGRGRAEGSGAAAESAASAIAVQLDHETIARRAYEIWERNGRADGRAINDWLEAEAQLRWEQSS